MRLFVEVLFLCFAIGQAFAVSNCDPDEQLGIPFATYNVAVGSTQTACPTTSTNTGWEFNITGINDGQFTLSNDTIADISCMDGNRLLVKGVSSLGLGTLTVTFTSTSPVSPTELQVNYFEGGFYGEYDGPVLSLPGELPPLWSSYDIAALNVKLCERTGVGLKKNDLFMLLDEEQCLDGKGEVENNRGPRSYRVRLDQDKASEDDVDVYELVLVTGECDSPQLTSSTSVIVNVTLPEPPTTSEMPTPTPSLIPTPSPNVPTMTPTASTTITDSPRSDGLSDEEIAVIVIVPVVVVVLVVIGVVVMVFYCRKNHYCCWKKSYRVEKPRSSSIPDRSLEDPPPYGEPPGSIGLSESGHKPPQEDTLPATAPSSDQMAPSVPAQKWSVVMIPDTTKFYNDLREGLGCLTSLHQPDFTDHRHFPQELSKLLIDQNCEWLFLIGSHTLEHRVENGRSTDESVYQAMQELTTAALPKEQLSKVVYVQLGAPSRKTISLPVTTILIPSSSNSPDYTGASCADEILQDHKVQERLARIAVTMNGTGKPSSTGKPRQLERLQEKPSVPSSDPIPRRWAEQPDGGNGTVKPRQVERLQGRSPPPSSDPIQRKGIEQPDNPTGSASLGNVPLEVVLLGELVHGQKEHTEALKEHTEVLKEIRDNSKDQTQLQESIANNTGAIANDTNELRQDASEIRQLEQQRTDREQNEEDEDDEVEQTT